MAASEESTLPTVFVFSSCNSPPDKDAIVHTDVHNNTASKKQARMLINTVYPDAEVFTKTWGTGPKLFEERGRGWYGACVPTKDVTIFARCRRRTEPGNE